jgi:hypothetical protein
LFIAILTVLGTTRILVLGGRRETDVFSVVFAGVRNIKAAVVVEEIPDDGVELRTDDGSDSHFVLADPDLEQGVVVIFEGRVVLRGDGT